MTEAQNFESQELDGLYSREQKKEVSYSKLKIEEFRKEEEDKL